jgi:hypothetical protein
MKNFVKWFGIIALIAVIGFSFASCDDGTMGGGVPDAPTGLTVTVTSNTIQANWNAVSGAAVYILYVSASSNFDPDLSASE